MHLEDISKGDISILSSLLSFSPLSVLLKEICDALNRNNAKLTDFEDRFEAKISDVDHKLERVMSAYERFSQVETSFDNKLSVFETKMNTIGNIVANSVNRISDMQNDISKIEKKTNHALIEASKAASEVNQITAKFNTVVTINSQSFSGSSVPAGGGTRMTEEDREMLVSTRNRSIELNENLSAMKKEIENLQKQVSETHEELRISLSQKADKRLTEKQLSAIEPKVEKMRGEIDKLFKTSENLKEEILTKADLSIVNTKASKDELNEKATKLSVSTLEKKVLTIKNDIALTGTMIDNMRKVVDDCNEETKSLHLLLDSTSKTMQNKAEISYVDKIHSELDNKFRANAVAIREICRTKADFSDLTSLETQVISLMNGEDAFIAAGRMHFRCLSCDRFGHAISGPGSEKYDREIGIAAGAVSSASTQENIALFGNDGKIYHGAVPSVDLYGISGATITTARTEIPTKNHNVPRSAGIFRGSNSAGNSTTIIPNSSSSRPMTAPSMNGLAPHNNKLNPHPPQMVNNHVGSATSALQKSGANSTPVSNGPLWVP